MAFCGRVAQVSFARQVGTSCVNSLRQRTGNFGTRSREWIGGIRDIRRRKSKRRVSAYVERPAGKIFFKRFENWRQKFKAEPQLPKRKLLHRRGGLSHGLSHTLSHSFSHTPNDAAPRLIALAPRLAADGRPGMNGYSISKRTRSVTRPHAAKVRPSPGG